MRISDWSSDVCSSDLASGPPSDKSTRNERSPRRGKEFKMTMTIFQCDFPFEGPWGTQLAEEFHGLARDIASEPSLVWKYWTENEEAKRAGGIYLFTNQIGRASCRERVCQYV